MPPPISILQHPSAPINNQVSIAQISAGGMVLHWYESVAIVQELCQTLGNQSGHPMLDWSTVFVQSSGRVTIRSSDSNDPIVSVRAIGELLGNWLAETPYPRPLSLVVAQCTSTPSFYRSAAELSKALSHYERPNRLELIRNVYERWRSADPASPERSCRESFQHRRAPSRRHEHSGARSNRAPSRLKRRGASSHGCVGRQPRRL